MNRRKLSEEEIAEKLKDLDGWTVKGKELTKRYEFENFAGSLEFVNKVGEIAEEHDHHPDITFGWGYAEIALTTHDTGGLTEFDFAVASAIDAT
ncbi:MAG: 4a-hydroxytetrahydrobiopterin dehydratase [Pyrinomonadaceae bacterium]|nr:4a-hydroxytetrahydrobiopterin dehydratase [Pyrinomonadaceae bacterium]